MQVVVRHPAVTDATDAALAYMGDAGEFVDDAVGLPLPPPGFVPRIEEITAIV
ncbi:hypothetical protein [Streptomyces sp. IBSBF 2435]|uniref:hypothetical protein n=1 Tax=Streptomyces sp. IBSBF 2435 TaxID=2903531 RepID=UPI002FDC155B